jgi:hypothetical protein
MFALFACHHCPSFVGSWRLPFHSEQITLLTGKILGLLVSGPESAIAHDALLAHAWVAPPRVSIDPVRVEASKFVYRPPGCDPPRAPVPAKLPVYAPSDLCVPDSRVELGVCGTNFYPMGLVSHHGAKNSPDGAGGRCSGPKITG